MTFTSVAFVVFLPVVFALYWATPQPRRPVVLVLASYVFYGYWDARLLGLLMLSTLVDHVSARRIAELQSEARRRRWLMASLTVNLGVLAVFKYLGFFVDSASDLLGALGFEPNLPVLEVVLPVGISFYTFQSMAYTIDVHRGRIAPEPSLLTFAAFVSFFPQLVAGPIERAERLLPQLRDPVPLSGERLERAVRLIVRGLVLKLAVADTAAPIVGEAFADLDRSGALGTALAAVAFGVQVYGDFAGYSAMARGIALLFGVDLVANFAEPYLSVSVTEFWRRWHMSLSQWLRDYLYIPLGGNRGSDLRTRVNLLIVMGLGGLWHGAAWGFVIWGLWHGLWLAAERGRARSIDGLPRRSDLVGVLRTQVVVLAGWPLFRSESMADIGALVRGVAAGDTGPVPPLKDMALVLTLVAIVGWFDMTNRRRAGATPAGVVRSGAALGAALAALIVTAGSPIEPFIYFQF